MNGGMILKKLFLLAFLGILVLSQAACANGDGGGTLTPGAGRYVETDITPPVAGRFISLLAHDGSIVVFDEGLRTRFDSMDGGETWVQSPGPGSGTDSFASINVASFLPDGRLMAFVPPNSGLIIITPDGSYERFPVEQVDAGAIVSMIAVLDDNRLLLTYSTTGFPFGGMINVEAVTEIFGGSVDLDDIRVGIQEAIGDDLDNLIEQRGQIFGGGGVREPGVQQGIVVPGTGGGVRGEGFQQGMAVPGGMRFLGGQTTSIHDLATGRLIEELQAPNAVSATQRGDFHVFRDQSILLHDTNDNMTLLLDGAPFAFGAQDSVVTSVLTPSDGSVIVNVATIHGNRLYRIFWDADATVNPDKVITIWSLEYNAAVRAAISELWRRNPDAYITYEIALTEGSAMSASDAIRTLNTRLLARSGPDVLILDGTPIDNYAGRGMLLDLAGRVNTAGMYQNLISPFTAPTGQIFVIPTQFSIPALMGDARLLNEVASLGALVDRVVGGNPPVSITGRGRGMLAGIPEAERSELHFGSLNELFDLMWYANVSAFIYDNRLDTDALRDFLHAIQSISDMHGLTDLRQAGRMGMTVFGFGRAAGGMMPSLPGSLMQYMMQTTNMAAFSIDHLMLLQFANERGDGLDLATFPGLTQGAWVPSTIAGVSADSDNPDFAVEFINTLLSQQVQGINHGEGLPVTRAGMAEQISDVNETLALIDLTFTIDIEGLIQELRTPAILETTLREIIWNTVERLCTARIDLEGAVREIEQSIRNYLAERS